MAKKSVAQEAGKVARKELPHRAYDATFNALSEVQQKQEVALLERLLRGLAAALAVDCQAVRND